MKRYVMQSHFARCAMVNVVISVFAMGCGSIDADGGVNSQVVEGDAITSFAGTWSRDFEPLPGLPHTATYTITEESIHYALSGSVGTAEYEISRDEYIPDEMRFVGHTDKGDFYVIFVKDVRDHELTLYKKEVESVQEGLDTEYPALDDTRNHGWNVYTRAE